MVSHRRFKPNSTYSKQLISSVLSDQLKNMTYNIFMRNYRCNSFQFLDNVPFLRATEIFPLPQVITKKVATNKEFPVLFNKDNNINF